MRVFICVLLILASLGGGIALALTTDNYSQLFGLYDARGLGFIASIVVFLLGVLLLLIGGRTPKTARKDAAVTTAPEIPPSPPREASATEPVEASRPSGPDVETADVTPPPAAQEVAAPTPVATGPAAKAGDVDTGPAEAVPADLAPDVSLQDADARLQAARKSKDPSAFDEAIAAYAAVIGGASRQALGQRPRVAANMGNAYLSKARMSGEMDDIEAAIECLEVATMSLAARNDTDRLAETYCALGSAHQLAFVQTRDTASLEAAQAAFQNGADSVSADALPDLYVQLHHDLANALRQLGQRKNDPDLLEASLKHFRASLEHCSQESMPRFWVLNVERAALAKETLGKLGERPEQNIREATAHLEAVAQAIPALNMPNVQDRIEKHLERLSEKAASQSQG